jgi:thiol:disulfide interchange protein
LVALSLLVVLSLSVVPAACGQAAPRAPGSALPIVDVAGEAAAVVTSSEAPPAESAAEPLAIGWIADADAAQARARREGRPLVVFVHADWSAASIALERRAFSDARVRRAMQGMVALRLDLTELGERSEDSAARFDVVSPPSVIAVDRSGARVGRLDGNVAVEDLLALIARAR